MIWPAAWTREHRLGHNPWDEPQWRGRRRYWDEVRWGRTPELDLAVACLRWKIDTGWEVRYYLLFRRIGEDQIYQVPVLAQTYQTTPTGSLQTSTSDATWNNSNNKVECIGGGGSGGAATAASATATGGGGGTYSLITNFTFASPGSTTYQWQVATGGASVTTGTGVAGNPGGSTWFNSATDPGNGANNTKCGAEGGGAGGGVTPAAITNGGTAATTASWGTTKNAGGRGGNVTAAASSSTGAGGAGGPTAAGAQGVDTASAAAGTNGGAADVGGTGAGTAGTGVSANGAVTGGNGGAGTELGDSVHGCGGGGGAARGTTGTSVGGTGGLYGGGGGGCKSTGTPNSGAGAQGILVLTWTPGAIVAPPGENLYDLPGRIPLATSSRSFTNSANPATIPLPLMGQICL